MVVVASISSSRNGSVVVVAVVHNHPHFLGFGCASYMTMIKAIVKATWPNIIHAR